MAVARRRAGRQQAINISNCVGASFQGKKVEWDAWIRSGEWIVWGRYPLPMNAAVKAEMDRLTQHESALEDG